MPVSEEDLRKLQELADWQREHGNTESAKNGVRRHQDGKKK